MKVKIIIISASNANIYLLVGVDLDNKIIELSPPIHFSLGTLIKNIPIHFSLGTLIKNTPIHFN
jgi:hypothetical protein